MIELWWFVKAKPFLFSQNWIYCDEFFKNFLFIISTYPYMMNQKLFVPNVPYFLNVLISHILQWWIKKLWFLIYLVYHGLCTIEKIKYKWVLEWFWQLLRIFWLLNIPQKMLKIKEQEKRRRRYIMFFQTVPWKSLLWHYFLTLHTLIH